jgi:hypothetical protein
MFITEKLRSKMIYFRINGSQFSPCIISKVRYTLGISKTKPINNKTCSTIYWNEAVTIVAKYNKIRKFKQCLK